MVEPQKPPPPHVAMPDPGIKTGTLGPGDLWWLIRLFGTGSIIVVLITGALWYAMQGASHAPPPEPEYRCRQLGDNINVPEWRTGPSALWQANGPSAACDSLYTGYVTPWPSTIQPQLHELPHMPEPYPVPPIPIRRFKVYPA